MIHLGVYFKTHMDVYRRIWYDCIRYNCIWYDCIWYCYFQLWCDVLCVVCHCLTVTGMATVWFAVILFSRFVYRWLLATLRQDTDAQANVSLDHPNHSLGDGKRLICCLKNSAFTTRRTNQLLPPSHVMCDVITSAAWSLVYCSLRCRIHCYSSLHPAISTTMAASCTPTPHGSNATTPNAMWIHSNAAVARYHGMRCWTTKRVVHW